MAFVHLDPRGIGAGQIRLCGAIQTERGVCLNDELIAYARSRDQAVFIVGFASERSADAKVGRRDSSVGTGMTGPPGPVIPCTTLRAWPPAVSGC